MEVIEWLRENAEPLGAAAALTGMGGVGYAVIKKIINVVRIKKHVGAEPAEERIVAQNNIVIINSANVELVVDRSTYEAYKSEKIDKDLELMTRPLQEGRINSAQITVQAYEEETISRAYHDRGSSII